MWESLSFLLKAFALAIIFSLLAIGAGVGFVKAANKKAREREAKENRKS